MRAARLHAYGPPESLVVEDLPDPAPGPGEVLVDVAAAAVNFPDVLTMANRYQVSVPLPFTPGAEFSGLVRAVGAGVEKVRPGDAVLGSGMTGAFASCLVAAAEQVERLPPGADLVSAAALWVASRTAHQALTCVAHLCQGEWLVVLGAAGGVGLAAVEIGRLLGARVIAAASSPAKLELCLNRGANAAIDYSRQPLKDTIREITGEGADVVIDPVGGGYAEQALRATRWGARFVTIGYASGEIPRIPLNLVLLKGVSILGFDLRTFASHAPEQAHYAHQELLRLFTEGRVTPYVSDVFALSDVSRALRLVADGRALGKVLVRP